MKDNQKELEFEHQRLAQTIAIAKEQLNQARQRNEDNREAIIEAKKELRENTTHSIANLWGSEAFEALAAMNQYIDPITDKIADYEVVENKIATLEMLIKSPYFARIDFKFADEEEFEPIYIGRSSLKKEKAYDLFVYDWRSPIASVFYRFVLGEAYYDAPGGRIEGTVNLKRQYEINHEKLEYFFDSDVQIVDEFLRKLLSHNTSSKMKTIVETIQREQDIVIRDMDNELMMVQGVAGSGKTSIALHRAAYLMYQGLTSRLAANNIVIISPNTLFEQYISNVLPELGEENVVSVVFEEMMAELLRKHNIQSRDQFLEKLITSSRYRNRIKRCIEFKTSPQFQEILNRLIADIPVRWTVFEDVSYGGDLVVTKEKLKYRFASSRPEMPLGIRLKQLEDYIIQLLTDSGSRRINREDEDIVRSGLKKFTEPDMERLYRHLFRHKGYFYRLSKGIKLPEDIDEILIHTDENMSTNTLSYDDATALTYLHLKMFGSTKYKNIKQVVIDEAQDYYPLHFEIFNLLFQNSKFTVLGDINQTLDKSEDISLYKQIGTILNKKKSALVTMDKSFRCTDEIINYSLKFIPHHGDIKRFNRSGDEPQVHIADEFSLADLIQEEVRLCQDKGYRSIGLICKTKTHAEALYECLQNHLDVQLVGSDGTAADLQGVFIIPVYMSKGLEFDAVLICDADHKTYTDEDDKKLLYIACTRALHRLNLFGAGTASPLL